MKVHPRARRATVGGRSPDGEALRIAVNEAPEDGRANEAVRAALAKALGLPASAITLTHGAASRLKTLSIAGDPAALGARIEKLLA